MPAAIPRAVFRAHSAICACRTGSSGAIEPFFGVLSISTIAGINGLLLGIRLEELGESPVVLLHSACEKRLLCGKSAFGSLRLEAAIAPLPGLGISTERCGLGPPNLLTKAKQQSFWFWR
jgi:hypothetical protein